MSTCNSCGSRHSCCAHNACDWGSCPVPWNHTHGSHRPWALDGASCGQYVQPIYSNPAQYADAGITSGATLVIHKIVLEPCGNQSCTPRTFNIRITGPSYPCGEVFQLRAGNCLELDEPLVITGLEPGVYCIEELLTCPNAYITTYTGPVCGHQVTVTNSWSPTVVTIVNRRRQCRLCQGSGCGCAASSICNQ